MSETIGAIVLAAGAGTRMKSVVPKVLHTIAGIPMVGHALRAVHGAGVANVITVIGHGRELVEPVVREFSPNADVVVQAEQLGTGHAVKVALDETQRSASTWLVTYGDVPLLEADTLRAVIADHHQHSRTITILTAHLDDPSGYGRIVRDEHGNVEAIREHKDATTTELAISEVNSGILVLDGDFLPGALAGLSPKNAQGELYLTDIVATAVSAGLPVGAHVLADVWQTEGANDRSQLAELGREMNRRITRQAMLDGVTIVDPETTWIDATVTWQQDVTILPGTQLHGSTVLETGAVVGPDTTLRDVHVGAGARVIRTHGEAAVLGPKSTVGPFAYLRPGTVLDESGKIGTFVETKNTHIGPGAKVPHLSYMGDADIAEGTNIGAGTITANYDGVNKHRTAVGRHARTGSGSVFVAPVSIGDGAYTAAGGVIRKDVPAGSLALGDGPQRVIDGWVSAKRPQTSSAEAAEAAIRSSEEKPGDQKSE